jgi:hypothetical protein
VLEKAFKRFAQREERLENAGCTLNGSAFVSPNAT